MGKVKEKIERRQIITGKKGIILLHIFSTLMVMAGALALIGSVLGIVLGTIDLSKEKENYVELIKSEDFEFSLEAINSTESEFLEYIAEAETYKEVIVSYISLGIQCAFGVLFRFLLYSCALVVTSCIKRNEDNPFTNDNLKALKKCATVIFVLYFIQLILSFVFDVEIFTNLIYLIVICVFVYLFDAGNRLQQAVEKKQ